MARTASDFAGLFLRLCPPSIRGLWSRMHATLLAFATAVGGEFARMDGRADDALEEAFPGSQSETLAKWEAQLGLTTDTSLSDATRQAAILAAFRARGGPQVASYIRTVCEGFGYDGANVDVIEPASGFAAFRAGVGACGDSIGGDGAHAHSFLVEYPAPTNATLEAFITAIKPAHTWVYFSTV